jgi:hypothetical protein
MGDGFDAGLNANLKGDLHGIVCDLRAWNNSIRHQGIKVITKIWHTRYRTSRITSAFGLYA